MAKLNKQEKIDLLTKNGVELTGDEKVADLDALLEELEIESDEKEADPEYHLEVAVNDVVFTTSAESFEQALTNFVKSPEFPFGAKTKMFFTYGKGDVVRKRLWQTQEARRLLTTISIKPNALNLLAEQLTRSLEE